MFDRLNGICIFSTFYSLGCCQALIKSRLPIFNHSGQSGARYCPKIRTTCIMPKQAPTATASTEPRLRTPKRNATATVLILLTVSASVLTLVYAVLVAARVVPNLEVLAIYNGALWTPLVIIDVSWIVFGVHLLSEWTESMVNSDIIASLTVVHCACDVIMLVFLLLKVPYLGALPVLDCMYVVALAHCCQAPQDAWSQALLPCTPLDSQCQNP